ncbi:MAG: hypothetical protein HY066_06530 [Betaproteobacteria bacterium]|nr:hypothetical protein [Betaproteobacteria bacterium]
MKTALTVNRRTQWLASAVAALGTLLTVGGPLMLAQHYAQAGASGDASGYYVKTHAKRIVCSDNGNIRTAMIPALHSTAPS